MTHREATRSDSLAETLQRITLQMTSSLDLDEVLRSLSEGLVEELGAASAQIWLAEPAGDAADHLELGGDRRLHLAAAAGLARTLTPEERRRTLVRFKVGEIARRCEPVFTHELPAAEVSATVGAGSPEAFAGCPLLFQGELLGVLATFSRSPLGPEEERLLELFARQAAIAIGNARLHAEVGRLKDRYEAENVYLQEEIGNEHNCGEIIGRSEPIRSLLAQIERVAPTETTVLIQGETGTGKELAALAIHGRSRRRERPMVKINCGAIAAGLVESELFGHEKGAFTGAVERRVGRFELADGGTLFLDEVGELPPQAQVKLLRVLQEGELERVGSSRPIRVDVRVIAATHRDLEAGVREGTFRADLFYRLDVFPLRVPPLRERREDIPLIASCFLGRLSARLDKPLTGFTRRALDRLQGYSWPGNVRELLNAVERAAILSPGPVLDLDGSLGLLPGAASAPAAAGAGPLRSLRDVESEHIRRVLEATGWVVEGREGAATILGLAPSTLRSRMHKLGIERPG